MKSANAKKLHQQLAKALFPKNPGELGGEAIDWKGKSYVVTTGTGDGNYAYLDKDVKKWLDAVEDRDVNDMYSDFVDKVDPETSKELAKFVYEELDIELYDGGTRIKFDKKARGKQAYNFKGFLAKVIQDGKVLYKTTYDGSELFEPEEIALQIARQTDARRATHVKVVDLDTKTFKVFEFGKYAGGNSVRSLPKKELAAFKSL